MDRRLPQSIDVMDEDWDDFSFSTPAARITLGDSASSWDRRDAGSSWLAGFAYRARRVREILCL